jgi:NRAMP (natural resistance-associated macrophage protein)-like metal ion transporter
LIKKVLKNIGPGPLVAAAFIGPGTVTVCTIAGAKFGLALLWAMIISIIITLVFQEMSARLGIISQRGLAELIKTEIKTPILNVFITGLILMAIVLGNAAYQAGNISGAVLGLSVFNEVNTLDIFGLAINVYSLLIGAIAFFLLYIGSYKILERSMISLVIFMSISFVIAAIITKPNLLSIFNNIITFRTPENSLLTVVALIGTTVVPYNLFLHSALAKEKWKVKSNLKLAQTDTIVAVVFGGLVSMSIIITAASLNIEGVENASDLALGLAPVYGNASKYVLALGLFAAGITSAVTAPLAAAYVACGCLGWSTKLNSSKFRWVWMLVLLIGVIFASTGIKPVKIITIAQIANGLLLPLIAVILIWMMNQRHILGVQVNSKIQNLIGVALLVFVVFLGAKSILQAFQWI